MTETKRFPLRVVLTVTTRRLLTERRGPKDNGIGDLYEILDWMTGGSNFTLQLPRVGEACEPYLLELFPELAACGSRDSLARLDKMVLHNGPESGVDLWLRGLEGVQQFYEVPKIPRKESAPF